MGAGKSSRSGTGGSSSSNRIGGNPSMANEVSISHILGTSWSGDLDLDTGGGSSGNNFAGSSVRGPGAGSLENVTLVTYARYVLKQICTQPWVHQRCLQVISYHFDLFAVLSLNLKDRTVEFRCNDSFRF